MSRSVPRLTEAQINTETLTLARQGMGKVDLWGLRGATLVSVAEIEAMALVLALLGVAPIRPEGLAEPAPAPSPVPLSGGVALPLLGPADV